MRALSHMQLKPDAVPRVTQPYNLSAYDQMRLEYHEDLEVSEGKAEWAPAGHRGEWGSASFVVHVLAAFFWYWRAAPPATNAPREPAPAIVVLEPRLLDTCPAECPAPSLAFCASTVQQKPFSSFFAFRFSFF